MIRARNVVVLLAKNYIIRFSIYSTLLISIILFLLHIAISFKDWSYYSKYIAKELEKIYDFRIHIGGDVKISLITPKLSIHNLYLQYEKDKKQESSDLIRVKKIEIRPSILSMILTFSLEPKSITFFGIESNKENLMSIISGKANVNKVDIVIRDSQINFNNYYSSILNVREFSIRKNKRFFGEVKVSNKNYSFSGRISEKRGSMYISVSSNFISVLFTGNKNQESFDGNLVLKINNNSNHASDLVKMINLSFLSHIIPSEYVKITSNITLNKGQFIAADLKVDSKSMKAVGTIQSDRKSDHTNISISLSKFDMDSIQRSSYRATDIKELLEALRGIVPRSLNLNLNIEASSIQCRSKILGKFYTTLKFTNGIIEVMALLQSPENNISHLSGKVSSNGDLSEFNGDLLIKGNNFASYFFPSVNGKEGEINQFAVSSRIHLAPRILSLSDIKLLKDEESWQGSLMINYTKKHDIIDGKFSVHNLNINKYNSLLLSGLSKMKLLKNLKYDINIITTVENFVLNDIKIENLGLFLKIGRNLLRVDKIKIFGKDFDMTGSAQILFDQKYTKPLLDINLRGSKFNGDIFKLPGLGEIKRNSRNEINQIQWSTKPIRFLSESGDFDANLQIKTEEFKTKHNVLKDFSLDSIIRNDTITIRQVSYLLEDGQMFFQGHLNASSIHIKFSIVNFDTKRIIGVNNINGYVSLSGEIKSQGRSFYEWASNLSGNVNLKSEEIEFSNVDFNLFITKLLKSKNKLEISKLAHVDIYNGSTFFKSIIGKVNINNGICSTSLQFSIDKASGYISSNLILSNFSLTSVFRLFFILPNYNSPFYVEAQLDGPIWRPKMSFDIEKILSTFNFD